ncbi:TPR repeat-containing protein [Escherichia coli]|nr:TPR repeat-containing protein [Escherichia coli]
MTPVKVWQERVEIPTYETGPQDIHPCSWKIAFIRDRPARFIPTA